ncbi:MAG: hypothetical protein ACLFR0_03235 [Alphaproteobacteria bacterium]
MTRYFNRVSFAELPADVVNSATRFYEQGAGNYIDEQKVIVEDLLVPEN